MCDKSIDRVGGVDAPPTHLEAVREFVFATGRNMEQIG